MGLFDRLRAVAKQMGFNFPAGPPPGMADTFCILPWQYLLITHDGTAKKCCLSWREIARGDTTLSIGRHSLEEIWNSDEMRQFRRDMVSGQPIASCEECYSLERHGGISIRQKENRMWESGRLNEDRASIDMLKAQAVAEDYRLTARPVRMQLHIGNLCNLKCRMCTGHSSSRINKDPVHRSWTGLAENDYAARFTRQEHWFQQGKALRDNLLRDAAQLRQLEFLGGETLLSREVGDLLQLLVDAGAAEHIALQFTTNATTTGAAWLTLTERFLSTRFAVSIDGFGAYHEYIRYPARWPTFVRNIEVLRRLPRATAHAHVTLQNCNVLNVVELFRFLDAIDLPFSVYPLQHPPYLQATVLPPRARRLAADRMRQYADQDCRAEHQELVRALAAGLEAPGEGVDAHLLREFMLFTNDLDATRGQDFQTTHAELLPFFQEAGFPWTAERRHAAPGSGGRVSLPLAA